MRGALVEQCAERLQHTARFWNVWVTCAFFVNNFVSHFKWSPRWRKVCSSVGADSGWPRGCRTSAFLKLNVSVMFGFWNGVLGLGRSGAPSKPTMVVPEAAGPPIFFNSSMQALVAHVPGMCLSHFFKWLFIFPECGAPTCGGLLLRLGGGLQRRVTLTFWLRLVLQTTSSKLILFARKMWEMSGDCSLPSIRLILIIFLSLLWSVRACRDL